MNKYIEHQRYLTECRDNAARGRIARRCFKRERKSDLKLLLSPLLGVVLGFLLLVISTNGGETPPPTPTENAAIVDTTPEAVVNEHDPVRWDIPLDAETQRLLYEACGETGIRYELALAVIWQETTFRNVIGDGGDSYGYMQIQPQWHSERMERLGVTDLNDPYSNFLVGCDFLAELLETHDLTDALTRYNSGKTGDSQYAQSVLNYMNILTTEEF